jgi:CheY-like chemotaxis protein/anti-sigma regulatory factor (Ser/Thr protein kinase)
MSTSESRRILIVEDNPFNRKMLQTLLEQEGFAVEECKNGKEAIERLKEEHFSLIFTDLLMPGMDGFETIRRIRDMGIATPIVTTSSMNSKQDRQRCLEAGADDFLPKPIQTDQIRELLKKYEKNTTRSPATKDDTECAASSINASDYRILLVEEDEVLGSRYQRFLEKFGFQITRVFHGDQAWEIFKPHKPDYDIIISNVFTSGIDGLGLLVNIKRDYPDTLVFIYAAEQDTEMFQLAARLGADGILIQAEFESSMIAIIESAIYRCAQKTSRTIAANTVNQVRKAQANLMRLGCAAPCNSIDIAYSQLTDAGGDVASCRRFNSAGRCGVVLGDVSGHNVMSSYISAIFLGILSSVWNKNQNPTALLRAANAELNKADYADYHLCASALLWDRRRGKIKIATAGNPGVLWVKKKNNGDLDIEELCGGGMCLGWIKEDLIFAECEIEIKPGDYLFLFSDGIDSKNIIDILHSDKALLNRDNIRGISQQILDRILAKQVQKDDMILVALSEPETTWNDGLHYSFPSTYSGVDAACLWAADMITAEKIPEGKESVLVLLAIREALINAVRHGNLFLPHSFVDLSLYVKSGELRADISDEGPGFEFPATLNKIEHIRAEQLGNRGLAVMNSVSDQVFVNGSTVSLIFRRNI